MLSNDDSTHLDSCLGNGITEEVLDVVLLVATLCVHTQSRLRLEVSVDADLGLGDSKLNWKSEERHINQPNPVRSGSE